MQYLAIDTTTKFIKLALYDTETFLKADLSEPSENSQATELVPLVDTFLSENNIKVENLDKIIVNLGPGPYTSLRIGIATAKALALPHGIEVVGVNTFDVIKYLEKENLTKDFAIILYNTKKQAYVEYKQEYKVVNTEDLSNAFHKETIFLGNGVLPENYEEYLKSYKIVESDSTILLASELIDFVIEEKIKDTQLEPLYIKPLNYKKQVRSYSQTK